MKNLYTLLLILTCSFVQSQVINFPDANFKAKLLASNTSNGFAKNSAGNGIFVDTNNNGEIEISEALNVYELYLWSNFLNTTNDIIDLNGIQYFQNLRSLNCFGNSITTLNLVGLNNIEYIQASKNNITDINVTGLNLLKEIKIDSNLLTSINIDNLSQLTDLWINENNIQNLVFNNNSSLESLWCYSNTISTLDFSFTPNLKYVVCDDNNLNSINFGTINSIIEFTCAYNNLTSVNINNFNSLIYLDISSNQFSTINFPTINNISYLDISNNPISNLNLNNLSFLNQFNASNILVTSLDCSQTGVQQLFCSNNPNLQSINVQNNVYTYSDPDLLYFGFVIENNPNLVSICVDNGEQNNLTFYNYNTNGNVTVYTGPTCSTEVIPQTFSNTVFDNMSILIYPNPTNNIININSNNVEIKQISIYNILGQLVKNNLNNQTTIDVSDLKSGTYLISIETENGIQTQKFIKL